MAHLAEIDADHLPHGAIAIRGRLGEGIEGHEDQRLAEVELLDGAADESGGCGTRDDCGRRPEEKDSDWLASLSRGAEPGLEAPG